MAQERSALEKFFVFYAILILAALGFAGYLFLTGKLDLVGIGLLIFILVVLGLAGYFLGTLAYNINLASLQAEVSVVIAQLGGPETERKIGFSQEPAVSSTALSTGSEEDDLEMEKGWLKKRFRFMKKSH